MTNAPQQHETGLPGDAQEALRRLYGGGAPADPGSREFLMELASERLGHPGSRLRLRGPLAIAASVALLAIGGVLIAIWNTPALNPGMTIPAPQSAMVAGDADGNGAVDVRDAFLVARAIRDGSAADSSWDVVPDGAIDHEDVQRILSIAVTLPSGGE